MTLDDMITQALKEDIPSGDLTTAALQLGSRTGSAHLVAKQDLTLSGRLVFDRVMTLADSKIQVSWAYGDGDQVLAHTSVAHLHGPLASLLTAERTALNFLGRLTGIATLTSAFVRRMAGTSCRILDTRKTTPLYRDLEKAAVRDGGGLNHRRDLSEAILIKENHIRATGGLDAALKLQKKNNPGRAIEIEVSCLEEIRQALAFLPERMLFDNMSNDEMKQGLQLTRGKCMVEASGNMTLDRVESIAKLGVDFISVGQLTHSAPVADLSLLFEFDKETS